MAASDVGRALRRQSLIARADCDRWRRLHGLRCTSRRRLHELERATADLEKRGAEVFTVVADVRDQEQAANAVELTLGRFGSINAMFKGRQEQEFAWFSLGSATPLSSIAARRAARQIVIRACRYSQAQLVITLQARLALIGAALFPNLAAEIIARVNRLLPAPATRSVDAKSGWRCRSNFPAGIRDGPR